MKEPTEREYAHLVYQEVKDIIENAREGTLLIILKHLFDALESNESCCFGRAEYEITQAIKKLYGIYLVKEKDNGREKTKNR